RRRSSTRSISRPSGGGRSGSCTGRSTSSPWTYSCCAPTRGASTIPALSTTRQPGTFSRERNGSGPRHRPSSTASPPPRPKPPGTTSWAPPPPPT
ncbi:unnamed protein product, partial [Ectocarpus sp. 12 AP-2014]